MAKDSVAKIQWRAILERFLERATERYGWQRIRWQRFNGERSWSVSWSGLRKDMDGKGFGGKDSMASDPGAFPGAGYGKIWMAKDSVAKIQWRAILERFLER